MDEKTEDNKPTFILDELTPEPSEAESITTYKIPSGGWFIIDEITGRCYFAETLEQKGSTIVAILNKRNLKQTPTIPLNGVLERLKNNHQEKPNPIGPKGQTP